MIEQIGDCTLYCGDCLDVMPTLGPVDAVVTDPPYGVSLTAKRTKQEQRNPTKPYNDEEEHIKNLVLCAFNIWNTQITSRAVVTPGTCILQDWPKASALGGIFTPANTGGGRWGFQSVHPILYFGSCPYMASGLGRRSNGFYSAHPGMHVTGEDQINHPCPKPIAWMKWIVQRASLQNETILDPFMGSGTTGVACVNLGRKFIGIEKDPEYFEIACERIREAYQQPDMFIAPPAKPVQEELL